MSFSVLNKPQRLPFNLELPCPRQGDAFGLKKQTTKHGAEDAEKDTGAEQPHTQYRGILL